MTKPPALRPGDTIALVAPAGPVDAALVKAAVRNLERRGYKVAVMPGVRSRKGYLAGPDGARARDLESAFADPKVRMVLCLRGGYGSPRIVDLIDYDLMRRNPKIFVGYSDISALLTSLNQKANVVTFHGPMAATDFSGKGLASFSSRHFWPLVEAKPGNKEEVARLADWGRDRTGKLGRRRTIAPGVAEGTLTGGNLSTIVSLLGTPYEIDTKDKILFIEDVNEEPFRIDRMLCQLHLSGKLRQCRGFLVGGFTRCEARKGSSSLSLEAILKQYLGGLNVPAMAGFPAGHLPEQATLPFGSHVRLDAGGQKLSILERPVSAAPEKP